MRDLKDAIDSAVFAIQMWDTERVNATMAELFVMDYEPENPHHAALLMESSEFSIRVLLNPSFVSAISCAKALNSAFDDWFLLEEVANDGI